MFEDKLESHGIPQPTKKVSALTRKNLSRGNAKVVVAPQNPGSDEKNRPQKKKSLGVDAKRNKKIIDLKRNRRCKCRRSI